MIIVKFRVIIKTVLTILAIITAIAIFVEDNLLQQISFHETSKNFHDASETFMVWIHKSVNLSCSTSCILKDKTETCKGERRLKLLKRLLLKNEGLQYDNVDRSLLILESMYFYAKQLKENNVSLRTLNIVQMNGLNNMLGEVPSGPHKFANCPIKNCNISGEKKNYYSGLIDGFDVVLWTNNVFWPNMIGRNQSQLWVIQELESPARWGGFPEFKNLVNFTSTFRWDSTIPFPYARFISSDSPIRKHYHGISISLARNDSDLVLKNKDREVAWLVSNCQQTVNNRWDYAMELSKYIQVDIYGSCTSKECDGDCFEMLRISRNDILFGKY